MLGGFVLVYSTDSRAAQTPVAVSKDPVASRGLAHTRESHKMVESAIEHANELLEETGFVLPASWLAP